MTYEKKQAFEADSEKIEALQQPGQFPELVATDESLVALYNEQLTDGQSLTPLQAEDRAMDDETNWTTMRTFFRRAQRQVGERLTVIVSFVSAVLTDVFGHLHERLDGSTEDGIPAIPFGSTASPAVAETLGYLPSAVRLLRSRKITNGATDTAIPDGCSLARLLCDSSLAAEVTEIVDDNTGWTMVRSIASFFPNAVKMQWGCKYMRADRANFFNNLSHLEELELTDCEIISGNWSYGTGSNHKIIGNNDALRKFKTPGLKELRSTTSWSQCPLLVSNPVLEEWYSPKFEKTNCSYMVHDCPNLQRVVFGKLIADFVSAYGSYGENFTGSNSKMVHFEIGAGTAVSLHLNWWSPTMALRTDTDADDYVDLREDTTLSNNLAQFLTNFRSFIALRLTDNGAGKTLTLSQSVRDAIHSAEATYGIEDIIITQKGWAISPAPTV